MKTVFSIHSNDCILRLTEYCEDVYTLTIQSKHQTASCKLTTSQLNTIATLVKDETSQVEKESKPKTKTVYKYAFKTHKNGIFYESAGFYETEKDFIVTMNSQDENLIVFRIDSSRMEVPA